MEWYNLSECKLFGLRALYFLRKIETFKKQLDKLMNELLKINLNHDD